MPNPYDVLGVLPSATKAEVCPHDTYRPAPLPSRYFMTSKPSAPSGPRWHWFSITLLAAGQSCVPEVVFSTSSRPLSAQWAGGGREDVQIHHWGIQQSHIRCGKYPPTEFRDGCKIPNSASTLTRVESFMQHSSSPTTTTLHCISADGSWHSGMAYRPGFISYTLVAYMWRCTSMASAVSGVALQEVTMARATEAKVCPVWTYTLLNVGPTGSVILHALSRAESDVTAECHDIATGPPRARTTYNWGQPQRSSNRFVALAFVLPLALSGVYFGMWAPNWRTQILPLFTIYLSRG